MQECINSLGEQDDDLISTGLSDMSTQNLALFLTAQHGDWVVRATAIPTPGPKDVLVKVIATALNPVNWKIQLFR